MTWNVVYYNHINKEMFHLHFVLFMKSEFGMMSLNTAYCAHLGCDWTSGPCGSLNTREIQSKNKSVCENTVVMGS